MQSCPLHEATTFFPSTHTSDESAQSSAFEHLPEKLASSDDASMHDLPPQHGGAASETTMPITM